MFISAPEIHPQKKEGNGLFNDAINTFCLRLYGIRYIMVKDHSDSQRGNPVPRLNGLLFLISSKGSFISHKQDSIYQSWSTGDDREIAEWVHHEGSIR